MKILPKLEVNVDGYNDENQETVPMAMFGKTVGELLAETDKVNELTAENAKLREQLAEAVELLRNVRNANSVTRIIMDYDDIDALLKKVKLQ